MSRLVLDGKGEFRRVKDEDGNIVAMLLQLGNGRWSIFDKRESRITQSVFKSPEKALEFFEQDILETPYVPRDSSSNPETLEVQKIDWEEGETRRVVDGVIVYRTYADYCWD